MAARISLYLYSFPCPSYFQNQVFPSVSSLASLFRAASVRLMRFGSRGSSEFLRRLPAVRLGYFTEMHLTRRPGKTPYRDQALQSPNNGLKYVLKNFITLWELTFEPLYQKEKAVKMNQLETVRLANSPEAVLFNRPEEKRRTENKILTLSWK